MDKFLSVTGFLLLLVKNIGRSDGQISFTMTPSALQDGAATPLTLNCSYKANSFTVVSLAIKKLAGNATVQIASIDASNSVRIEGTGYGIGSTSGLVDLNHGSFLSLTWAHPGVNEVGTYTCRANVINPAAFLFFYQANKTVSYSLPEINGLTQRILELESQLNDLKARTINAMSLVLANIARSDAKIGSLQNALFRVSAPFHNHRYYLSLYQPHAAVNAEFACEALGGYLAEVDTPDEFRFLGGFIGSPIPNEHQFLLGGTDAREQNQWIFRHSGTSLAYVEWGKNQPDNREYNSVREDCQTIDYYSPTDGFKMNDMTCFKNGFNVGMYFVCEVPL